MSNHYPRCGKCGSPMGEVMLRGGVKQLVCCDCGCTRTASLVEEVLQELIRDMKGISPDVPLSSLRSVQDLDREAANEALEHMHGASREEVLKCSQLEFVVE